MPNIVECFINGQGMQQQEAEEHYQQLKVEMSALADTPNSLYLMEEKMYEYGLELDYVEELCMDILGV